MIKVLMFLLTLNFTHAFSKVTESSSSSSSQASSEISSPNDILSLVDNSSCAAFSFPQKGKAPKAFLYGIANVYHKNFCQLEKGNASTDAMSAVNGVSDKDALTYYGLKPSTKVDRLRTNFAFLVGLALRESHGNTCTGRDSTSSNYSHDTVEAGIFQTSYNAVGGPVRQALYKKYKADKSGCELATFSKGYDCTEKNKKNWGSGEGAVYQKLAKECPAFSTELAAINVRVVRRHYGPINRKEVTYFNGCFEMFKSIEKIKCP